MDEKELAELTRLITEQVMARMAAETPAENTEGKKKLLVVGKPDAVPETLRCGAALLGLDDYEKNRNILRYDAVCVTKLTLSQLADAALGKPDSPAACALVYALLENVPVTMLESALPHKKYAGRQSAALYELYETYARSLQIFGVKLLRPQAAQTQTPAKPPKFCPAPVPAPQMHGAPNPERVITEDMARKLALNEPVHVRKDAIITPAAQDALRERNICAVRDE